MTKETHIAATAARNRQVFFEVSMFREASQVAEKSEWPARRSGVGGSNVQQKSAEPLELWAILMSRKTLWNRELSLTASNCYSADRERSVLQAVSESVRFVTKNP
jgi:hypothetical protein